MPPRLAGSRLRTPAPHYGVVRSSPRAEGSSTSRGSRPPPARPAIAPMRRRGSSLFRACRCERTSPLVRSTESPRDDRDTENQNPPREPKGEGPMEIAEPGGTGRDVDTATLEPMPDVEAAFEENEVDAPLVGTIMGSPYDKPKRSVEHTSEL